MPPPRTALSSHTARTVAHPCFLPGTNRAISVLPVVCHCPQFTQCVPLAPLKKKKKKDSMFLLAKMHLFSLFLSLRRAVLEIVQCCAAKPTGVAQSVPTRRGQDGPSACTADGARLTGVRVWGKYTRSKVNPSCRTTVRLRTPYLTGPCPPSD